MILKNGKRLDGCSDTVPIGTLNPYIGSTPPFGYLICEGQLVDKTTYPELYAICGSTFGTETTTQFYLPDLRGQTIAGYKQGDSDFGTLGALIGSKYMQRHYHDLRYNNSVGAGVTISTVGTGLDALNISNYVWDHNTQNVKGSSSNLFTNEEGTGESGNIQPTMVLNWIVKAFMLMPNQSMVSTVETTSDINTYSCNYINNIVDNTNNVLSAETFQGLSNITDANEHTLITKVLNKGYYLLIGNISVNYYAQSGREIHIRIYKNNVSDFTDVSVINIAAYTMNKPIVYLFTAQTDNTTMELKCSSSVADKRYDIGWSFMQFIKLRDL